jgi:hypothetical protein
MKKFKPGLKKRCKTCRMEYIHGIKCKKPDPILSRFQFF